MLLSKPNHYVFIVLNKKQQKATHFYFKISSCNKKAKH